jgi:hypothetical protein
MRIQAWVVAAGMIILQGASGIASGAEITHKIKNGEIVITNRHVKRRFFMSDLVGPGKALVPVSGSNLPASAPDILEQIDRAAKRYGFDPALVRSVVAAESSFDAMAVSKKGARGLMQLMPLTAREYGVRNVHDPAANLNAGLGYLRTLLTRFNGDLELALAAYNAGPEAVIRYGGVPPYRETRNYIKRIKKYYGSDLGEGDWSNRTTGIRIIKIERGGVPRFTNIPSRKLIRTASGKKPIKPRNPKDE